MLKRGIKKKTPQNGKATSPFWADTKRLIEEGDITPFISNFFSYQIFGSNDSRLVASAWADDLDSPAYPDSNCDLARIAQFYSIQNSNREAKLNYLDSLKDYLFGLAQEEDNADEALIESVMEDQEHKTFSEVAYRLGYPKFKDEHYNPLRLLAELPLPIYITTCYHDFLEVALSKAATKKEPVSEIYYWSDGLRHIESIFDTNPDYEPSIEQPLVYHLYGLDKYPESLVLTEDDYLNFLVRVTQEASEVRYTDQDKEYREQLPTSIIRALGTPLLMLGYNVYDWEFRALFKGLVQPKNDIRLAQSISIQVNPGDDEQAEKIKAYLIEYFKKSSFKVHWGDPETVVRELWEQWST